MYQDKRGQIQVNPTVFKRVGQVVIGFGLLFAVALAFQNCSGYQTFDSVTQSSIGGSDCGSACDQSVNGLGLKITNSTISIFNADLTPNRVVDIGGYCDDADFPQSDIQYQWYDNSTPITGWTSTGVACDDIGRFQISAAVPATSTSHAYLLAVRLAIPVSGGQYLVSSAAQRSLQINVY